MSGGAEGGGTVLQFRSPTSKSMIYPSCVPLAGHRQNGAFAPAIAGVLIVNGRQHLVRGEERGSRYKLQQTVLSNTCSGNGVSIEEIDGQRNAR
jgi:hypothetical protein